MYTAHYDLKRKPFQISSDSSFMWLGENHKEALATLRYGILDNKGFLLLTGDVGTGKTTLINALIGSLSSDVIYASVPDPNLDKMDFFNYIAAAFGLGREFDSKGKFLASFTSFLHRSYEDNKKVLLIIDECQLMTQELLEEIRLLSNIVTTDSNPLLNIFLVGQYEFNELIRRPENRAIAQRITLNYYIEPLTLEETGEYIKHRLKIAGTTKKIFNSSAIKEIFAFSEGYPRKINIICDHCLMSGYADDKQTISSAIVRESSKELQIPEARRGQDRDGQATAAQPGVLPSAFAEQPGQTMKLSISWPVGGLLIIIMLLMSFGFYFLYYTNLKFQEATARFTTIQEKVLSNNPGSQEKSAQPEPQRETVSPAPGDERESSPVSSGFSLPAQKKPEPVPVAAKVTSKKPEPVPVAAKVTSAVTDQNTEITKLPLPDAPLVIQFESDSNVFSVSDIDRMKEFARVVRTHPDAMVDISGYTDSIGDPAYNTKLSEFRANMVKSFLLGQNLHPDQIRTQGLGNKNPVDRNDTAEGRVMNRRVEISVIENR
jgi:general secretion pathway protein A